MSHIFHYTTASCNSSAKNHAGTMVSRQYTPISRPDQIDYFEVVIKVTYGVYMFILYIHCISTVL